MIELQVVWAREGQLCLWGLDEGAVVDAARLEDHLAETGLVTGESDRRVLSLRLPGQGDCLVPALAPEIGTLCRLLGKVAEEMELTDPDEPVQLGTEVVAGGSLKFVALVDRLALELIARGRLLPELERVPSGWRSRWRAVPDEAEDAQRIELFRTAMPGSLMAAQDDADSPEQQAIATVLNLLVDGRARMLLSDPGLSRRDTAPPKRIRASRSAISPAHAWTKALSTASGEIDAPESELSALAIQLRDWAGAIERDPGTQAARPAWKASRGEDGPASGRDDQATSPRRNPPRKLEVTLVTRPVDRRGDSCEPEDPEGRLFALDGLCDFEWRVAVGDQKLTVAELRELAAAQLPLIRSDGRWTVVAPEQVRHALEAIDRHGERGRVHAGELLRDSLALRPRTGALRSDGRHSTAGASKAATMPEVTGPAIEFQSEGWLRSLTGDADREIAKLADRAQPAGLRGELRPYQRRGFAWLDLLSQLGLGACLADDMGLGKTIQLLALLLAERERAGVYPGPTLLICPVSVVGNWRREAEKFAPGLRVHVHYGAHRERGTGFRRIAATHDLAITSYSLVSRDRDLLGSVAWDRIVLDEAQHIKSRRARQTQAIRALKARHRIALTGTPVENRLTELHSIMDFLNPGLLGSADAFKQQIARPIEDWRDPDAAAQLRQATAPFILRRLKTDRTIVPDLPEKIEMRTDCLLTKEQASLYQAVVDDLMAAANQPEGIARSGAILAALTKLKQVCNHPGALLGDDRGFGNRSGKLMRLEEILEEALAEGDRALCFTQFSGFGQRLAWHLADLFDCEVPFLHGGTSRDERDEMVRRFQSQDGPPIFVLSLRAGGVGLNLTAANQVIHFDRWWNPAVEDQATDRAYRIGQRRNVQVRKLTCVGTLEERIDLLLERKRDLAEMIVGSGESWITELDSAQLRELVALSPEAIDPGNEQPSSRATGRPSAPEDEALAA